MRETLRALDVSILRRFISSRKKNDNFGPSKNVIDAVSRAIVYSHFLYTLADRAPISSIA